MGRKGSTGRPVRKRPPGIRPGWSTGRDRELAALTEALACPPLVALIEGEAGTGKSWLVGELLSSPAGRELKAMVACCPPVHPPRTLGPIADALRQAAPEGVNGLGLSPLAGALRPLFPEWAASLPPACEPAEDASAARHRVFRAIAELLDCLDVAVLVVEDAHWADEATLEFLLHLISGRPAPVSLVVTYRLDDLPDRALLRLLSRAPVGGRQLRLALSPIDPAETAVLVP